MHISDIDAHRLNIRQAITAQCRQDGGRIKLVPGRQFGAQFGYRIVFNHVGE